MKKLLLILSLMISLATFAQKTTYILIRHAEKDTTAAGSTMMNADPPLSKAGEARTIKLIKALKKYKPTEIYSTNYTRTKSTVTPLAQKLKQEIQLYSPKDLKKFAENLLAEKDKTIVIVGHSNTTPALVNLLIKKEEYKALDESVYNKIFIVTVTAKETTVKVSEY